MSQNRKVAVTGLGILSPVGNTVAEFWQALLAGKSGIGPITRFDTTSFATKFAGEIKNLDMDAFIPKKEQRHMDPFCQYGIVAAREAVADSGIKESGLPPERIGVIVGSGVGGLPVMQAQWSNYMTRGVSRFSPFMIPQMISNILPGFIAIENGFKGPNFSVVSACVTATHSIGVAFDAIRSGRADAMVTGGAEGAVCELGIGGFNSMKALSTRNDDPQGASRPFDRDRDGFVLSEGAGILVLEEMEHAKARGARIYCELAGFGATDDAYHITAPDATSVGPANGMKLALEDAELSPADIDYINAHGTSTQQGDLAELRAIKTVFGDEAYKVNISSTKSMTGHMMGAAGAAEALACIHAIRDGVIPPTINFQHEDPQIDYRLNLTLCEKQERRVRVAVSNNFGFGGQNASLVFRAI